MSVSSLNDFALDPRTGDVIGAVPVSSMEHVADTVAMARTAQTVVGSVSPAARAVKARSRPRTMKYSVPPGSPSWISSVPRR